MSEYREIMRVIDDYAHPDSERKYGTAEDENMPEDAIRITIIATGLKENNHYAASATTSYSGREIQSGRVRGHVSGDGYGAVSAKMSEEGDFSNIAGVITSGRDVRNMNLAAPDFSDQRVLDDLEIPAVLRRQRGSIDEVS